MLHFNKYLVSIVSWIR